MHSEKQTPHINAAREFGALVAGGATYQTDELRLKAVDNHIQKALGEICEQYKDANGKSVFSKEQIDCLNHVCLQLFCILDPNSKPPTSAIGALFADFNGRSPLKKWGIFAGFLAGIVALFAIYDFVSNKIHSKSGSEIVQPDPKNRGKGP